MTRVTTPLPSGAFRASLAGPRAFSLIEVVLAVGVVAFAFVAIMGLIPAGMSQFRQAIDTSVCAQIAQRIINEAQETDFTILIDEKNLPTAGDDFALRTPTVAASAASTATVPGKCIRYFDEQGMEVIPAAVTTNAPSKAELQRITYMVNTRVIPKTVVPSTGVSAYHDYHLATLTIQIASNPGNVPITLSSAAMSSTDPSRRLWIATPGVSIITYCAQIGRN